jgi:hypothetical protein
VKDKSKANAIVISFFVAFGILCLVSTVVSSATPSTGLGEENLYLKVQGVSQNGSYFNVALSILNCGPNLEKADKIQIHETSALTYINGTEIIDPNQMNCYVKSGDTLQVNLMTPIANYTPNATVGITVYTPKAMYYIETNLP